MPPTEPHDVRAHLLGGVPAAEVANRRQLFDALGFKPDHAFTRRDKDPLYFDFAPALVERAAIRPLVENDIGVQVRQAATRKQLAQWWTEHSRRLVELPQRRDLNRVRTEFLDTFVAAMVQDSGNDASPLLDRFKLSGVIATWWTDTLPDLKTVLENGFPSVVDGWIDAVSDAVEDDEAAGPNFDPFGHKLVRRTMADYLARIASAKADIAQLKGEKEAFEQSNAPDDLDEKGLAEWNYAKELERQMRELKTEHKADLKKLAKLEKVAAKVRATAEEKRAAVEAKTTFQPVLDELAALETALVPYQQIKEQLTEARSHYRTLTDEFVNELKSRCGAINDEQKRTLVLELFAEDVQAGLDSAVIEKQQELVRFVEGLWDKYRVTVADMRKARLTVENSLDQFLKVLNYAR
jgi:type I restriction enzyme M protein